MVDLIVLEAIRHFEPDVYYGIRASRTFLTRSGSELSPEQIRSRIGALIGLASEPRRHATEQLLALLFPTVTEAFRSIPISQSQKWSRELQVCSVDAFDRYFQFDVPRGQLSQTAVRRLLDASSHRESTATQLKLLESAGLLDATLATLILRAHDIHIENAGPFIAGLCDVGDDLFDDSSGIFDTPRTHRAWRIIGLCLERVASPSERGDILARAFTESSGISLPAYVVDLLLRATSGAEGGFVPAETLARMKGDCVERIKTKLTQGTYPKALRRVLGQWLAWGDRDEVRDWCVHLIATPSCVLVFLRAMLQAESSLTLGDYVTRTRWFITVAEVEQFVSFDLLEASVSLLESEPTLSEEDSRALAAFRQAAAKRRASSQLPIAPGNELGTA